MNANFGNMEECHTHAGTHTHSLTHTHTHPHTQRENTYTQSNKKNEQKHENPKRKQQKKKIKSWHLKYMTATVVVMLEPIQTEQTIYHIYISD